MRAAKFHFRYRGISSCIVLGKFSLKVFFKTAFGRSSLNLQSSGFEQSSLFQSEMKFYWGAYSPRVFFKTAFGRSSLNLQPSGFEQSSLLRSEMKFYWGAYSPSPLGRCAPKVGSRCSES